MRDSSAGAQHAAGDRSRCDRAKMLNIKTRLFACLYHVCDYLAAAASPSAPSVAEQRELLRANRSADVFAQLRPRIEPPEQPDAFAPVRCAVRYMENRPHQLDYAGALARGLPVGSGLIESGHRHVLQKRLKLSGTWWSPANAYALAQLRTCRANARFDIYWANN